MEKEKKLTKLKAFWLTYSLWEWMADTGSDSETHWPEWIMWGKIYKEGTPIRYSPLSKFYIDRQNSDLCNEVRRNLACKECANECHSIWNSESEDSLMCCVKSLDSIYFKWIQASDDEKLRKKYAKDMANKFYGIYIQLGGNKKPIPNRSDFSLG